MLVQLRDLFFEEEVITEARAPSAEDSDPEALVAEALRLADFHDLGSGFFGESDHLARSIMLP
jgi:hypothetical protein